MLREKHGLPDIIFSSFCFECYYTVILSLHFIILWLKINVKHKTLSIYIKREKKYNDKKKKKNQLKISGCSKRVVVLMKLLHEEVFLINSVFSFVREIYLKYAMKWYFPCYKQVFHYNRLFEHFFIWRYFRHSCTYWFWKLTRYTWWMVRLFDYI